MLQATDFPKLVHIQTSTKCDSRCIFCPNKKIKSDIKCISWDLCKNIIDQCVGKIDALIPFRINEPLLYPDLFKLLEYAQKKIPETRIYIYTNAIMLTKQMAEKLISYGVEWFYFSVAGVTPETYKQIQGVDAYGKVVENINNFRELVKNNSSINYTIGLSLVQQNFYEAQQFRNFWGNNVQIVAVTNIDRDFKGCLNCVQGSHSRPCKMIFRDLFVGIDGRCCLCCDDWNSEAVVGDLKKNTIEEIWKGEVYKKYRQLHLEGKKYEIPLCKNCRNIHAI